MATLTLVRHGQASFLTEDYDRLSPLGEEQSRLLGTYWVERGVAFDRVYTGPLKRQVDTGGAVGEVYKAAGLDWPEPVVLPEFEEYHAEFFLKRYLPSLVDLDADIRELKSRFDESSDRHERGRLFQKIFERGVRMWLRGEIEAPDIEPFDRFERRVGEGVDRVRADCPRGGNCVVFTSGGPCAAAARLALDGTLERMIELVWMVRNGALTEFLFTEGRFNLSSFNRTPHLDERRLQTYR